MALRLVTGAGWIGLGVTAGLLLYEAYYTPAELAAVKAAAIVVFSTPPRRTQSQ